MKKIIEDLLHQEISRRDAVIDAAKIGSAVAITSAITLPFSANAQPSVAPAGVVNDNETVRHSACLVNCGSRCPLKVIVKDDRIVRIEPEDAKDDSVFGEHQIRPCLRGRSNRWRVYSPDRIKYPMKRVGKRGEGKFKRISWEEATAFVASEMKRIAEKYGNEAIYYNYQSGAYYHNQGTHAWKCLLNLTGGYLNYHNTYSTAQIATATPYTHGTYVGSHFTQIAHSDLVVFFWPQLVGNPYVRRRTGGGTASCVRKIAGSRDDHRSALHRFCYHPACKVVSDSSNHRCGIGRGVDSHPD